MKTKHTKGPWTIEDKAAGRRVVKGDKSIVIIESWTTEPDARLIAAAPALLEALKDIEAELDRRIRARELGATWTSLQVRASRAIALAESV
ncbi:hypothetical protein [Nitrospira sp. BLG_1]|uniref:hypothetical protein n=1 Tax=Nitrospira sp. BLG_1 TaxID=3395883 RepID=UPI0039BCD191